MLPPVFAHQWSSSLPKAERTIVDKMSISRTLLSNLNTLQGNIHGPLSLLHKGLAFELFILVSQDASMREARPNEPGVR
jgi:hypothetical protein